MCAHAAHNHVTNVLGEFWAVGFFGHFDQKTRRPAGRENSGHHAWTVARVFLTKNFLISCGLTQPLTYCTTRFLAVRAIHARITIIRRMYEIQT